MPCSTLAWKRRLKPTREKAGLRRNSHVVSLHPEIFAVTMARLPRLVFPHHPHLIAQHGNNSQVVFGDAEDYLAFLNWLGQAARQFKVTLHAYVLLPDRFNLLVTPSDTIGLGRMMQWVGRHYVPYFNRKYSRSGTLWQARFKAAVIDAERYLMACCHYIEQSPVRASLVATAADYAWSSYAHHAGAKTDTLITEHALYWALGNTPFEREATYRKSLEKALSQEENQALEQSATKGWALGTPRFKTALEKISQRSLSPARRGRPAKPAGDVRAPFAHSAATLDE